jgi:hypothetical protein
MFSAGGDVSFADRGGFSLLLIPNIISNKKFFEETPI